MRNTVTVAGLCEAGKTVAGREAGKTVAGHEAGKTVAGLCEAGMFGLAEPDYRRQFGLAEPDNELLTDTEIRTYSNH